MVNRIRLFRPILAGANARDRAITCLAAAIGITLLALTGTVIDGPIDIEAWIFAPVGASAVLVFAVPASPLTQPWPVIGGLLLSSCVGIAVGAAVGHEALAIGLAVGLAIAAMSMTRTLHPPGGAAAITAALGVSAGWNVDMLLPLILIGLDAVGIVLLGLAFHRVVTGHSYPHVPPVVPAKQPVLPRHARFGPEDVDAVLARIDDTFDIGRADLEAILRAVEEEAEARELTEVRP